MILVVGATGTLGGEIARALAAASREVRGLVRPTSDPERVAALVSAGVEIREADLKQPDSLAALCEGVDTLISTASSTLSRQSGDDIQSVDLQGQIDLLAAARAAGVSHMVFVSFPPADIAFPLQDAKRQVEQAIRDSGIGHTILQPTHFWESWLSPALGFDATAGRARLFAGGRGAMRWISVLDVRDAALGALYNPGAMGRTFALGGPELLNQEDIVQRFEAASGHPFEREPVPEAALEEAYRAATDPLQKSFAALSLLAGRGGWDMDMADTLETLAYMPRSVDVFIARHFG
jgi:uncharacterized protein YbjT (DUF2867 family)